MPGFLIGGTGVGSAGGNAPNSLVEVRRTHRWIFETIGFGNAAIALFLKSASRPSFQFEEPAMHHNQEQVYYAGKQTWEAISMSFYDIEQDPNVSDEIWQWLQTVSQIATVQVSTPGNSGSSFKGGYKTQLATLAMVDGYGAANESWNIWNGWPQNVNWNALDYSSTDLQLVELKYRYDRALKTL